MKVKMVMTCSASLANHFFMVFKTVFIHVADIDLLSIEIQHYETHQRPGFQTQVGEEALAVFVQNRVRIRVVLFAPQMNGHTAVAHASREGNVPGFLISCAAMFMSPAP